MKGVVIVSTGAWFDHDTGTTSGVTCRHGNTNVLTPDAGTSKLAQGPAAHSCLINLEKWTKGAVPVNAYRPPVIEDSLPTSNFSDENGPTMSWNEWRSHDLEAQFNPRTAVGVDVATSSLDLWATESKARKVELTGRFDLPYGAHKLMRFDLHLGAANKPIIINIHGGYWRALDKADVNHHMADLAKTGFGLVNMNYPLCPEVSLTQIIEHLNHGVEEYKKA